MTTDVQTRILDALDYLDDGARDRLRRMLDRLEAVHGVTLFMLRVRKRLDVLAEQQRAA
jgi:hypothetical protein